MRTNTALLRKLRRQEKRLKVLTAEQRRVSTRLQARSPDPQPATPAAAAAPTPPSGGNPE